MAIATIEMDGEEKEVKDGEKIIDACEELGVAFGCTNGLCGTCRVDVEEGMENLTEATDQEKDMEIEGEERLACQCKIKKGKVKIKYM